VDLAFISKGSQDKIGKYLNEVKKPMTTAQARELRRIAEANGGKLTVEAIKQTLTNSPPARSVPAVRLGSKMLSEFFTPEQSPEDIEAEIIAALRAYRGIEE
jgi:hypothetical protein